MSKNDACEVNVSTVGGKKTPKRQILDDNSFLWPAFCVQQYIVEMNLDTLLVAGVICHSPERDLSLFLRRVHPKILITIVDSKLVFPSVKILLKEYSCLRCRLRRSGENEHCL